MNVAADLARRRAGIDTGVLDLTGVTIRPMPHAVGRVLGSDVDAITLGRTVYVAPDRYSAVASGEDASLLLHELVHVAQWQRFGHVGFLWRYASEYVRNRMIGLGHKVAYRAIPFEAEAFGAQNQEVLPPV